MVISVAVIVFTVRRIIDLRREMARRGAAEASMRHMALHDALTGLNNRLLFSECLDRETSRLDRRKGFCAVLCLDLDRFKQVNDVLGHGAGDALLKQVAERLQNNVREMDTIARFGGDEFAIIHPALRRPDDAAQLAERLVQCLSEPYDLDDEQVIIGVSIGIAVAGDGSVDAEDLIRRADVALYRSKEEGRGTYRFFEADMDARLIERRSLEHDLRGALEMGGLHVHYQPLIDLATGQVTSFEALVRWTHPERGSIPPCDFIPLAEETGLILKLGEYVLRKATEVAAAWPDEIGVAVNLSSVQFSRSDVVETVRRALDASGLPAHRLEVEITESILLEETETTLLTLQQLKNLGVRIAMDDFGTGYSSLSYLRRFPFDKIKIDRSFVSGLASDFEDAAIVRAVIDLGQSLGMVATAEGVETAEQMRLLQAAGCGQAQGFLLGRPMPGVDVPSFVSEFSARHEEPAPRRAVG
jgi:diguanylate cyclase (GGDEF)-like protein